MLVIKAELWPGGDQHYATTLGRLVIVNDGTGSQERGNYQTQLTCGPEYPVLVGRVESFEREEKHVWALVQDALRGLLYVPTVDSHLGEAEVGEDDTR